LQNLVTDKIFKNHFFAETPSLGYYACRVKVSKCFWKWKCVFIIISKPRISRVAKSVRAKPRICLVRCRAFTAVAAEPRTAT